MVMMSVNIDMNDSVGTVITIIIVVVMHGGGLTVIRLHNRADGVALMTGRGGMSRFDMVFVARTMPLAFMLSAETAIS